MSLQRRRIVTGRRLVGGAGVLLAVALLYAFASFRYGAFLDIRNIDDQTYELRSVHINGLPRLFGSALIEPNQQGPSPFWLAYISFSPSDHVRMQFVGKHGIMSEVECQVQHRPGSEGVASEVVLSSRFKRCRTDQ
jgi:hypothetical protein